MSSYPGPSRPNEGYPAPTRPGAAPGYSAPGGVHDAVHGGYGRPGAYGGQTAGYGGPQAPAQQPVMWHGGQRASGLGPGMIAALCVVGFATVWGLYIVLTQVGPAPAMIGFVAALIPLAAVVAAVMWLDRWEPEPRSMLAVALLWGAGVSVVLSFYGNSAVSNGWYERSGDLGQTSVIGAVVSAPVIEELTKGAGVLLIYLLRRRYFDGVVDGLVYAAMVAAGFAFTENILYFGRSIDVLPEIFLMRGVMSPFAHILFTACIGIALGIASRHRNARAVWWLFPLGLLSSMLLHALWNGAAYLQGDLNFIVLYVLVQVPLFIAAIVLAFWLRRQESQVIRDRLTEYGNAGWFAPHEIEMVASLRTRSQARAWAGRLGPAAGAAMKRFQKDATSLAYARQRAVTGRADLRTHGASEQELLAALTAARQQFQTAAPQAFRTA